MLDTLRANSRSVLTYVLFGIIIVVFVVSFGPGSRGCTDTNVRAASFAARVGGKTITAADYEQQYGQLFRVYQQRAGSGFSRELADQLGLRKMAMDQLVERELMVQEAQRQGIVVADEQGKAFPAKVLWGTPGGATSTQRPPSPKGRSTRFSKPSVPT